MSKLGFTILLVVIGRDFCRDWSWFFLAIWPELIFGIKDRFGEFQA